MPGIYLAAPYEVEDEPGAESLAATLVELRTGASLTWTDWQGNVWDLATGESGVVLQSGVRGFTMPPVVRYSAKSPAVNGSRNRGYIVDEREVFWPLRIFHDSTSQDWLDLDRAFWRGLWPSKTGTWTFTQPNGESRTLELRFVDDGQQAFDIQPELDGWATYGVTLMAEQPFWTGSVVPRVFAGTADPTSFFGPSGGPPFYITSSSSLLSATVDNPGDVPSYPTWTLYGPFTNAQVGIEGQQVVVPFALLDGQWLVIDTAPTAQTALFGTALDVFGLPDLTGATDRTPELGAAGFAEIPPGDEVDLNVAMLGNGRVQLDLTPRYFRAW